MSQIQENQVQTRLANFKHKGKDVEPAGSLNYINVYNVKLAIPKLIALLESPHKTVAKQAAYVVGNIAGDSAKNGVKEMRRRRSSASIELRKSSRFDQMLKKRNIAVTNLYPLSQENSPTQNQEIMTIEEIMSAITSKDENTVFKAVQSARKILSKERFPPIRSMIDSGIVPHLVEFLSPNYSENFQFEACWALTNIASGNSEETEVILKAGALPKLIALLESPHKTVAEQAAWAVGNIAGDGPKNRDEVINLNALPALLKLLGPYVTLSTARNVVWTISNLCRNKNPLPPFNKVKICLPALYKMLHYKDIDVLADTCWSLSYLTDGAESRIQATIDAGVVPRVVELLCPEYAADTNCLVLTPALRTVGNIVTGSEEQTDCVINAGALPKLRDLLSVNKLNIVKEAAWSISNITAGNSDQIQAVIDAGILRPLIDVLDSGDFKSQKEAAWAVTNFTSGATTEQLSCLLQEGVLTPLCNLLSAQDHKIVLVVLDAIYNILHNAEKIGELYQITVHIEECGGVDKLENLQNHENETVYEKALNIIDKFFSSEDNEENKGPEEINGQYNFKPAEHSGQFNF